MVAGKEVQNACAGAAGEILKSGEIQEMIDFCVRFMVKYTKTNQNGRGELSHSSHA